ncbi:MAG TPA: isocitrate lyase/PEP mutase family protein [Casimicrobiaceae bacterium]|nr:isocitrate lyase/PEP mutase family protein [Casimicrobiaceae bacterium]
MQPRPTLRSALASERPLVTPLAHDALSARLIEHAGFRAFAVGGSALLATRYGLPDIGLIGVTDMTAGLKDIAAATSLPFFADGDDGYGDVKSVARTVELYEQIGVGAILIEDQLREGKQQRADRALGVADAAVIEAKLRVALSERCSPDTFIIGRTDAFGVLGLDEALRRAERFLALGVDGVFVAGLKSMPDYERVGRELRGARLSAAVFETSGMPWPTPAELGELGFAHVSYPGSLLFRITATMSDALTALRRHASGLQSMQPDGNADAARTLLDDALALQRWKAIEARAAQSGEPS